MLDRKETLSRSERRLAAIMFTDIAGYTSISQQDEERALEMLKRHNEILRSVFVRHSGREVKTIGDSFLVEFDSALAATECAVEIQQMLTEFNRTEKNPILVRIGVHLGDVVEEHNDIFGDAVNVASRIQGLAEPGEICISDEVYSLIRNKIAFPMETMTGVNLRNVQLPMNVYRILLPSPGGEITQLEWQSNRLAVLPLSNISPDPKDAYFADGMTEELITVLSQVRGLRVIARTSVDHYVGKDKRISQIAHELEVGTVMEGSVRMAGDKIRVTVQLINARNEEHLWSENYDRKLDDVFAIQSDIAKQVAQSLKVRLLEKDEERLDNRGPENLSAYTTYLKGRALMTRRKASELAEAKELFESTIAQDPTYAPAYAGLADAYYLLADYFVIPVHLGRPKARELATKAIEMDPDIAEPHATLGLLFLNDYRFSEAKSEFEKAITLNPSYANAHLWYSFCLGSLGGYQEALEQLRLAEEADPLSVIILSNEIIYFMILGEEEESWKKLQKALKLDPEHPLLNDFHGFFYYMKGDYSRATEIFLKGIAVGQNSKNPNFMIDLVFAYAAAGDPEKARRWLKEILALPEGTASRSLFISYAYAALGELDEFFAWSERAIKEKDFNFGDVRLIDKVIPAMHSIRNDPRFSQLFKKANLEM